MEIVTLKTIVEKAGIRLVRLTVYSSEALRDGWCDVLLYQDPCRQGYQAVHPLTRHILEGRGRRPTLVCI